MQREEYLKDLEYIKKLLDLNQTKKSKIKTEKPIVCDFTEYNPFHLGHKKALLEGKKYGFFISVLPGPLERSGRGLPYIFNRYVRTKFAIANGADLVVEGPPMGILNSGQYMICLIKMFYFLGADYIVRGYIPSKEMEKIIKLINEGKHIKIKTGKVFCIEKKEKICEKLEIDNYVIAAMSKTIYKLFKNTWNPKFIFVKRLEGISGTKIREYILKKRWKEVKKYVPEETLKIIKEEQPEILSYWEERILETVNNYDLYKYLKEDIAEILEKNRDYNSLEDIKKTLENKRLVSKNQYSRILCLLEARIEKEKISKFVEKYPQEIRVLGTSKSL